MNTVKLDYDAEAEAWVVEGPRFSMELCWDTEEEQNLKLYTLDRQRILGVPTEIREGRWIVELADTNMWVEVQSVYVDIALPEFMQLEAAGSSVILDDPYNYDTDVVEPWCITQGDSGVWVDSDGQRIWFLREYVAPSDIRIQVNTIVPLPAPNTLDIFYDTEDDLVFMMTDREDYVYSHLPHLSEAERDVVVRDLRVSTQWNITILTPKQHLINNAVIIIGGEQPNNYI